MPREIQDIFRDFGDQAAECLAWETRELIMTVNDLQIRTRAAQMPHCRPMTGYGRAVDAAADMVTILFAGAGERESAGAASQAGPPADQPGSQVSPG